MSKWAEIRNDFVCEDSRKIYIDAWFTEDDNEEGIVLARIDMDTKNIEYFDDDARTDDYAQEVIKETIMELNNEYFEAVEVCPHCDSENVYPMWDTEVSGFVAVCKTCGKEILLCDECQHTILQDGEVHDCDWCKTKCGGKCHRGCTKD